MPSRILATSCGYSARDDEIGAYVRTISFSQTIGNEEMLGNISLIREVYPRIAVSRGATVWIPGLEDSSIEYHKRNIQIYEDNASHPVIVLFRVVASQGAIWLEPYFFGNFNPTDPNGWRSLTFAPNDLFALKLTMPAVGATYDAFRNGYCMPFTWLNKNTSGFLSIRLVRGAPGEYSYARMAVVNSWNPMLTGENVLYAEGVTATGSTSYASQGTNADQVQMMVDEATTAAVARLTVPTVLNDPTFNEQLEQKVHEASEKLYVAV